MSEEQTTFNFIKKATADDETPEFPVGKYPIILADPPWRYNFSASNNRKIENHYPTMPLDEIKALDVPSADDCVLFLWTTSPKLEEAFEVIEAWGFQFKSMAVWIKSGYGPGYWYRHKAEYIMTCSKGNMKPPKPENRQENVIFAKKGPHSQKPVEIYKLIETMYPGLPKLEMFSRNSRKGWDSWGLEAQI